MNKTHAVAPATKILLSAIVPVGNMNGDLTSLRNWINKISKFPLKVILVHDVQDMKTSQALKKIVTEFNCLEVVKISGTFGSPGFARNAGISLANTPWVAFWDCDDEPILDNIFSAIQNSMDAEVLVGSFITVAANNENFRKKPSGKPTMQSVSVNPGVWRMIFRSHLLSKSKFTELLLAEDQVFLSEIKFAEKRIKFVNRPFYEYKMGAPNQLTKNRSNLRDLILASEMILRRTNKNLSKETIMLNLTLVLRQQLTLFKLGNTDLKMISIKLFFNYFFKANLKLLVLLLVALYNLLWSLRKLKLL